MNLIEVATWIFPPKKKKIQDMNWQALGEMAQSLPVYKCVYSPGYIWGRDLTWQDANLITACSRARSDHL